MAKTVATLDRGAACSSWNYSGHRLAAGSVDGSLTVFDSSDPSASSSFTCSSKIKVNETGVVKIVWLPPEYGDAVACICEDGSLSIWEEVAEDTQTLQWKLCKNLKNKSNRVLDVQFGVWRKRLKMVAAYSDGYVRIFELLDPLELKNWQLQAEFQNVIDSVSTLAKASCLSASVSWSPLKGENEEPSFVVGFNSDASQCNSSKVWEFDEARNRWLPVAELALPEDRGDQVYAVSWAPNIGRQYEVIAVATHRGIGIWHVKLTPELDGRLSVKKAALLSRHLGEVWQMEWDMSGMTLATTGSDNMVRLWQSNINGVWHEQATLEPVS